MELRSCPFCGNLNLKKFHIVVEQDKFYFMECVCCGAHGPASDSGKESIIAWNKRPDKEATIIQEFRLIAHRQEDSKN